MKLSYDEFLQTNIWKRTAERVYCKAGGQCEWCYTTHGPFNAHHLTYLASNRPDSPREIPRGWLPSYPWLCCLCEDCHWLIHHVSYLKRTIMGKMILQNRNNRERRRLVVIKLPYTEFGVEPDWLICQGRAI